MTTAKRYFYNASEPQPTKSLHDLWIPGADGDEPLRDYSVESGKVAVYFRNHVERCLEFIAKYDVIVGSVAWLTSKPILDALAKKYAVQIVVQKEDFLRPDSGKGHDMRNGYKKLDKWAATPTDFGVPDRFFFGGTLANMSVCGDPSIESVRCVGNHNSEKNPASPRAHHKFLVGCTLNKHLTDEQRDEQRRQGIPSAKPVAVWTGSFNLTHNGSRSFENVVVVEDERVAEAYYNEWNQIACLSEPLDWESEWCAPEWRIGT